MMLVAWLVTFFDGFDQNVVAFAAPYLIERLGLHATSMMSHVFGSGIAGSLIGGFLFGFVGDRIGRRAAIILCSAMFGTLDDRARASLPTTRCSSRSDSSTASRWAARSR